MNNFLKNLERDAERGLYISSYRAVMALEEYIIVNGRFLEDFDTFFENALLNGTVNQTNTSLMVGSTFPDWIARIQENALSFNLNVNITINNVTIYQEDPWHVKVRSNLTFFIEDITNIASWKTEEYIVASISILGFEDPLYTVNGLGRVTNIINRTPSDGNYTYKIDDVWNVTNLLAHAENSYYTSNVNAPSFLMRFENDLDSSPYGIESMVNIIKLAERELEMDTESSIIDYHYWVGDGNGDYRINFTPTWFKLDYAHLERYNTTEVSYLS